MLLLILTISIAATVAGHSMGPGSEVTQDLNGGSHGHEQTVSPTENGTVSPVGEGTMSPKPGSPVKVSITTAPDVELRPGDVAEITVSITSMVASDNMKITFKLTGGAEILNPEPGWTTTRASWTVGVERAQELTRTITVRFPDQPGGTVRVWASIKQRGTHGGRYSGHAMLKVPASTAEASPKSQHPGTEATDSQGRSLLEFRGE